MKRILITGANSFIGTSVENYLKQWPDRYAVDSIDMVDGRWKETSFQGYDVVYHVAGIVHMGKTKNDPEHTALYEKVNTRLAIDVAQKAKAEGVKQFIFMSSASVYGITAAIGDEIFITADTPLEPKDNYGISKLRAEEGIRPLADDSFKVVILRPPTVYGRGCKGNYRTLSNLARKLPCFPKIPNRRSMLYIDNLAEFIRLMVENEEEGIFLPQNEEFSCTAEMTRLIAEVNGKKLIMIKHLGWLVKLLRPVTTLVDSAFGSLCYEQELSRYKENYCVKNLYDSIVETEKP